MSMGRRAHEFRRIVQDPTLLLGLLVAVLFVAVAVVWPVLRMVGASLTAEATPLFAKLVTKRVYQRIMLNTVILGLGVAALGTALGFLFAFVQVRLDVPCKRFMHLMALVPIVSPPFAVATAAITLFGRSGIISYRLLGLQYNIYGLNGLLFVLSLSFFTVAYLNLAGMLRALDPAIDEAAINLGAGKWHVFRTITLPMLVPGIAGSFLLLFVEAIADLANPLVLGGDFTVLASRIYMAITGEYDVVAGAVLSVILLVPSLAVFVVQRYWVGRRSVVSVTGRPSGRPQRITAPVARWGLFAVTMACSLLILLIYGTVVVGAFTQLLGINNTLTL
ncbi:MAG TPA: ABC transporter permease subunit, partial [Anaerolineae bacterium]|nr:ABC transporter permease subunit [Anaerolineae bacterium]